MKDEVRYHQRTIEQFRSEWPAVDITDYPSATSPGLHLILAAVQESIAGDAGRAASRAVNLLIGLALVLVVYAACVRTIEPAAAAALTAPFLLSQYVLSGAIWLTTDNAALCFALGAVALCTPARPSWWRLLAAGICAALAVSVRQVHLWAAAPVAWSALMASPLRHAVPQAFRFWRDERPRWALFIVGSAAAALPFALMAWFYSLWGGLLPPMYAHKHGAVGNPATFAVVFALVGAYGVWHLPLLRLSGSSLRDPLVIGLAGVGLLAAAVAPTGFQPQERAFGAFWRVVELTPEVGGRSMLIAALATIGGACAGLLWRSAARAGRGGASTLLLLSMLGWMCAQAMNTMAWQRYFEPIILAFIAWLVALGATPAGTRTRRAWWGVGVLVLLQGGIALASVYREAFAG